MEKLKLIMLFSLILIFGCEEEQHGPLSEDGVSPFKIENLQFTPTNGGFDISYDLPTSQDLLYVKAVYENTRGEQVEVKTSAFNNKIIIKGFGDTAEKTVKVYSVDRSGNVSDAVTFSGSPLESPVDIIKGTMTITPDWGGGKFTWTNEGKTPIAIDLFSKNSLGKVELVKTEYTSQSANSVTLRGYESVPTYFSAVVRDRYDNISDTIYAATPNKLITPIFESRLDKTLFKKVVLANDDNWDAWEGDYYYLFDDDKNSIVHTQGNHPRPSICTIDLGVNVTLSRINVLQRQTAGVNFAYTHGNPKKIVVYGAKELPGQDGNLDDWIKLRECISTKPSGLPIGQNTNEDVAHFEAGDEYTFDELIEIRYFRFAVETTWDGSGYIDFSEMTWWGNILD